MHLSQVAEQPKLPTSDASSKTPRPPAAEKSVDRVLIHGRTDDGTGLRVLRQRDNRLEAGVAQPLRDGEPLHGEIVRLIPHKDFPLLCDVETQFSLNELPSPDGNTAQVKGPARVSNAAYRRNWSTVWGGAKGGSGLN